MKNHANEERDLLKSTPLPLPELSVGMRLEAYTSDNHLLCVARIIHLEDDLMVVEDSGKDLMPPTKFNDYIKLRGHNDEGNFTLGASVCHCSREVWKLDRIVTLQLKERRQYYRQSTSIYAEISCANETFGYRSAQSMIESVYRQLRLAEQGKPQVEEETVFPCMVQDVSVGGMKISCMKEFEEGDWLRVENMRLQEHDEPFAFTCRLRRKLRHKSHWEYGCEFAIGEEHERQRLLRAIMDLQRKEMRHHRSK